MGRTIITNPDVEEWVDLPGFPNYRGSVKGEIRHKRKKVETGMRFNSVKECGEYFGCKPTNISRVLTGERKGQKFHGYHLEYDEKEVRR